MQKTLALLAALALASAAAHAQTTPAAPAALPGTTLPGTALPGTTPTPPLNNPAAGRSPEQQAQNQAIRLAKELNLSADQQAKVQQLMNTQRQETQAAIQQAGGNRRAMGQAMRAGRDKFEGQLRAVLTAEQFTSYQQLMAQRRAQMRTRRGQTGDVD